MIISDSTSSFKLPDFIIVGAAKSGTTTIYNKLNHHEEIFMSHIKEPHYFAFPNGVPQFLNPVSGKTYQPHFVSDKKNYSELFDTSKEHQLIGEASTHYLYYYKEVINNIKKEYGDDYKKVKIIVVLRNPVERAWSHFSMKVRDGIEDLKFEDAINSSTIDKRLASKCNASYDYIGFSKYYGAIKAYRDNFEAVQILLYDDLKKRPAKFFSDIYTFLGVADQNSADEIKKYNISGVPKDNLWKYLYSVSFKGNILKSVLKRIIPSKKRQSLKNWVGNKVLVKSDLDQATRHKLNQLFNPEIKDLGEMINMNLNNWIKE